MRYLDRSLMMVPRWYSSDEAAENRRALWMFFSQGRESVSQTRFTKRSFDKSRRPFIASSELAHNIAREFHRKCAFCESPLEEDFSIHQFRPPENASPVEDRSISHLYYAWLAEAWQNHYPICDGCRPTDPSFFPVIGQRSQLPDQGLFQEFVIRGDGVWPDWPVRGEDNLLIDPCEAHDFARNFTFLPDGSVVSPTHRGTTTISHFHLNREELRDARARHFNNALKTLRTLISAPAGRITIFDDNSLAYLGGLSLLVGELLRIALNQKDAPHDLSYALNKLQELDHPLERFDRAIWSLIGAGNPQEAEFFHAFDAPLLPPVQTSDALPQSISIKGFKSLENLTLNLPKASKESQETTPSLLILGENAAGKSTILEGFALAMMSSEARGMLKPNGKPLDPTKLVLNPEYLGGLGQGPEQARITVTFADGEARSVVISKGTDSAGGSLRDEGALPLPVFAYGAFRQYLDKRRNYSPHRHVRSLFETDELLSNPKGWLLSLEEDDFNMVARALRDVFAIDGNFDVLRRDANDVFVISQTGNGDKSRELRTPLEIVSSGFRTVLAMLCDIMDGLMDKRVNRGFQSLETARGLVLIDEIEAHLHPRWKVSIMRGLRLALPNVYFIATSHDPLCLRGMFEGEVMVLERSAQISPFGLPVVTQATIDLPDNQNWTIQQLLTADFFKLHSTEGLEAERRRAEAEDALARGETPEDNVMVRDYLLEIGRKLPIGDSEVQRVVNAAIAEFLRQRREATVGQMRSLRDDLKASILKALRGDP